MVCGLSFPIGFSSAWEGMVYCTLFLLYRSPDITLLAACKAMQCLLSEPYPASPLNSAAADMLMKMPDMYEETVKIWTKLLAGGTVTTSQKYEEAVEIASALATSTEQAVKFLTKSKWNVQTACDLLAARTH